MLSAMAALNPHTLCNIYTLEQIEAKITLFTDQLEAATVRLYDKDTSQGRQKVESADIDKIAEILQAWLKAKECKTGIGGTVIVSGNFRTPNRGTII